MNTELKPAWDPRSEEVARDQRAAYDGMRERCPVAYSELLQWSLFRHADVTRAVHDHETFSNAVSQHLPVPNGTDPPEHTAYRRIIEPYLLRNGWAPSKPTCREIAADLVRNALASGECASKNCSNAPARFSPFPTSRLLSRGTLQAVSPPCARRFDKRNDRGGGGACSSSTDICATDSP